MPLPPMLLASSPKMLPAASPPISVGLESCALPFAAVSQRTPKQVGSYAVAGAAMSGDALGYEPVIYTSHDFSPNSRATGPPSSSSGSSCSQNACLPSSSSPSSYSQDTLALSTGALAFQAHRDAMASAARAGGNRGGGVAAAAEAHTDPLPSMQQGVDADALATLDDQYSVWAPGGSSALQVPDSSCPRPATHGMATQPAVTRRPGSVAAGVGGTCSIESTGWESRSMAGASRVPASLEHVPILDDVLARSSRLDEQFEVWSRSSSQFTPPSAAPMDVVRSSAPMLCAVTSILSEPPPKVNTGRSVRRALF